MWRGVLLVLVLVLLLPVVLLGGLLVLVLMLLLLLPEAAARGSKCVFDNLLLLLQLRGRVVPRSKWPHSGTPVVILVPSSAVLLLLLGHVSCGGPCDRCR